MTTTEEARPCGRPTRSQRPCANLLTRGEVACRVHATDEDRVVAMAWDQGYQAGYKFYIELYDVDRLHKTIQELQAEIRALKAGPPAPRRYADERGQLVEVGGYAYRWTGHPPLEVGEPVWLPQNYISEMKHGRGPWPGTVSALGVTYTGTISTIEGRRRSE